MASRSNRNLVPEAKAGLDQFKMESASEVGVTLKQGYNGDITAKQAGSIGGQMVKKMCPVRHVSYVRNYICNKGHQTTIKYTYSLVV